MEKNIYYFLYSLFNQEITLKMTLRRNPPGHSVILIFSGQKSSTEIF